jgi:hypothetical protein
MTGEFNINNPILRNVRSWKRGSRLLLVLTDGFEDAYLGHYLNERRGGAGELSYTYNIPSRHGGTSDIESDSPSTIDEFQDVLSRGGFPESK